MNTKEEFQKFAIEARDIALMKSRMLDDTKFDASDFDGIRITDDGFAYAQFSGQGGWYESVELDTEDLTWTLKALNDRYLEQRKVKDTLAQQSKDEQKQAEELAQRKRFEELKKYYGNNA